MLWAMFCWETLGLAIHVDANLTRVTYLNIVAYHQVHLFMAMAFPDGSGLFSRIMRPATLHTLFGNGLRNMMKCSRCCPGLQILQISIRLSICGMCWNDKSDPRRIHLATYRT